MGNFLQVKKGYWDSAKHDFSTLTSVELQQAATDIQSGRLCSNAKIQQLMRDVRLISTYTPESFGRKLAMRHLLWIRSLDGLWLREPIQLADVQSKPDPALHVEVERLRGLEEQTIRLWTSA